VNKLSAKYGFDAEAEIRELELPSIKIAEAAAPRRKEAIEKKPKAAKAEKAPVPSIPLPFCGKAVEGWCSAIVKNSKLYTQCTNTPANDGLCKKCIKISEKDGSLPFGIMSSRLECEPMSYKDPKGNAPVLYSAVMAKLNIKREEAEAEAAKFGLTIPEEQFAVVEKARGRPKKDVAEKSDDEKKARGRPKKDKPVKASSKAGDDIIAGLLMEANDNETDDDEAASSAASDSQSSNDAELVSEAKHAVEKVMKEVADKKQAKEKKPKQTEEEKAAAKEAAKAAKEAEKAAAKEAAKAAKEAEKAAKEAEKAAEKAAKEAEKAAKAKTEKPKAAKAVAEKPKPVAVAAPCESDDEEVGAAAAPAAISKPIKGGVAESKGDDASSSCEEESYEDEESESEEEEAVTVKKFEHEGKKYKISTKDNILYDWDDDEPVGVWNPKTKKIDELPDDDSEEEDEE